MPKPMHPELSAFLTDVWENRDWILYGADETPERNDTVEGRVYALYAPEHGATNAGITPGAYAAQLTGVAAPAGAKPWSQRHTGGFWVWTSSACSGSHPAHRLYLNAKPARAPQVFQRVITLASAPSKVPPPVPPRKMAGPGAAIHGAQAPIVAPQPPNRPWSDVILSAKIADHVQAFSGRNDLIVVYLSSNRGDAIRLGETLLREFPMSWFNHDIPPMSERVGFGVSVGPEVTGKQWGAGTSYGEVRCNLIAKAMLECITGVQIDDLSEDEIYWRDSVTPFAVIRVPVRRGPVGSPNRLEFLDAVAGNFVKFNINPIAPWREMLLPRR